MKFKLVIELGNAAMLTHYDIRRALIAVSNRLQRDHDGLPVRGTAVNIKDDNGNTVGSWEFTGKR